MSQINVQEGEISLNEHRNSITGSSGSHNLTGPRARFQPVRIKALLSLFESEDDDTEPRDSDDNSDTESLQALPDDDEDEGNINAQISPKDEDPPPEAEPVSITIENERETGVSTTKKKIPIIENIDDNSEANKLTETKQNDHQIFAKSNSFESRSNVLSSSIRKSNLHAPLQNISNDNADNNKGTILTPQASIDPMRRITYSQTGGVLSNKKYEPRQESLIHFDNRSKSKDPLLCVDSAMETPMKRERGVINSNQNSSLGVKNSFETPQAKLKNDYSQSVCETPGLIFSHWSRNNFFQTPTHNHNPIILPKKDGQLIHQMQDLRLQPHRLCSNDPRIVRKPLSEAMHINQGSSSSIDGNSINKHAAEYHENIVKSKENYPIDNNRSIKDNVANKIVQCLQDRDVKRQSCLSTFTLKEDKPNCPSNSEIGRATMPSFVPQEQKDYELMRNDQAGISDKKNTVVDGCTKKQTLPHNSEGVLNSKNNNYCIESMNGRSDSISPDSNGKKMSLPSPVDCKSNAENVQFSISAKPAEKKYGKMINVKGSDYLVLGKLGQGMSGEVLRVQEVKTGELHAIKCVDLSCIDKETAQGCLEEVSMLNRLRAPCIINMITYEIKSQVLYVVMEMGDTDLSKLLKSMARDKQLPLTMILYYWTEMLTAVKHIHDNGVIHSDLKPANFLLVRGRLKLIDFGIASTVNADMTSVVKNTSVGTLNYISPEAINDIGGNGDSPSDNNQYKINFKSDVWSLGCILYSLVYGQTPFQHIRANWAKVNAITNPNQKIAFPPPECTTRRGYTSPPPFLVDVMRRCLQHDRMARPSVSQLLQIPYVGCNCPPVSSLPSIPPSILSKIKHSLEENEWRQLLQALERRKPNQ